MERRNALVLCLVMISAGVVSFSSLSATLQPATPAHFKAVHPDAIYFRAMDSETLLTTVDSVSTMRLPAPFSRTHIRIDKVTRQDEKHVSVQQSFTIDNASFQLLYTQGETTGIGELLGEGKHWYFEVRPQGVWTVDITESRLLPGLYENDVVNLSDAHHAHHHNFQHYSHSLAALNREDAVLVDILLLYTPNIQAVYPGEMTQTLLHHLIAKANQSFADSDIFMQLRLVDSQFVDYAQPSNFTALNDLEAVLDGNSSTPTNGPLRTVFQRREDTGADIVAMIRTHDINEREVCGVAFFPREDSDVLINISNVGISGGSNCLDTFTHEIGHNFGAGHQRVGGPSLGFFEESGAFVVPGQFNTVMSSFGTGNIDRDLSLPVFSNLSNQCGGETCGTGTVANNANTMNRLAQQNANLRRQVTPGTAVLPEKSVRDADTDGTPDSQDAFPYLLTEDTDSDGDGVGDNSDAFPNDRFETLDTDGDGLGNNADNDDDGDGVADNQDALPLDARDSVDNDRDGLGPSQDQVDDDFQEFTDADGDSIGNVSDPDDDNDGVPDYFAQPSLEQSQVLVVSAGNDSILLYNETGTLQERLLQVAPGGLTFRSDLVVGEGNRAYFIAFSDVMQLDTRPSVVREAINRNDLQTNFPAHLLRTGNTLSIVHGLGDSYIDSFNLTASGNKLSSTSTSSAVFRDIELAQENSGYVVIRDQNRIATFRLNTVNNTFPTFASQGMDKPEHIAVSEDGLVYVTNAGSNNITYYNSQGQLLGTFIEAGSGGLGIPSCLEFGPDKNLFVCSGDTNQILQFDGQSGGFLSAFIDSDDGVLAQPVSLKFISKPHDPLPFSGDHDSDGDGVNNSDDDLPLDPTETVDTDGDGVGNNADSDDDGDGMPDNFEEDFGFDPLDASDANQDADGDGFTNLDEFNNGTDPSDPNSAPTPPEPPPQQPGPSSGSGGGALSWYAWILLLFIACRRHYLHTVRRSAVNRRDANLHLG